MRLPRTTISIATSSALLLLATACATRTPSFINAVDSAPVATTSPATDPAAWLLAHIDIETTGLVPGYHEPIDIGIVLTTLDGDVVDSLFLRIHPQHPGRISPGAARVNGYDAKLWEQLGALTVEQAVDSLFAFHARVRNGRNLMMVAFNSQFDTAFLDHLLRRRGRSWRELYHYFVLDIPSMAWARGYRQLTNRALADQLGVADEPRTAREHTGITGAMLNVRIYRALQKKVQQ